MELKNRRKAGGGVRRYCPRTIHLITVILCFIFFSLKVFPLPTSDFRLPTPGFLSPATDYRLLSPHKFHVTNSQIEYNPTTQSVEIVIRVFADDFQNAISKHSGKEIKLDRPEDWKDKTKATLMLAYLNENFALKSKSGRQVKLTWVGMEGVAGMFWVYIEGKMPGGLAGAQLKNRLHCELFDDQVNVLNTKFQGKQVGKMFEPKDEFKSITEKS